jgi:hypothetical protein
VAASASGDELRALCLAAKDLDSAAKAQEDPKRLGCVHDIRRCKKPRTVEFVVGLRLAQQGWNPAISCLDVRLRVRGVSDLASPPRARADDEEEHERRSTSTIGEGVPLSSIVLVIVLVLVLD